MLALLIGRCAPRLRLGARSRGPVQRLGEGLGPGRSGFGRRPGFAGLLLGPLGLPIEARRRLPCRPEFLLLLAAALTLGRPLFLPGLLPLLSPVLPPKVGEV